MLRSIWKALGIDPFCTWFRVFEWTPGTDGKGNPHVHIWVFCPFLNIPELRRCWRDALAAAGFPLIEDEQLIIDVRHAHGKSVAEELIKYLTKDILPDGSQVDPATYARVYEAFDGKRVTQASRGFLARAGKSKARCTCGAESCFDVRLRRAISATPERPGLAAQRGATLRKVACGP